MDRAAERRLNALKTWRSARSSEISLDPGVLCPNSALEAIAWHAPTNTRALGEIEQLKRWFVREFGSEVIQVASEAEPAPTDSGGGKERQSPDQGD